MGCWQSGSEPAIREPGKVLSREARVAPTQVHFLRGIGRRAALHLPACPGVLDCAAYFAS